MCIVYRCYTHRGVVRTNIDIDDDLLTEAMAASGLSTKKATVEEALRRLVQRYRRRAALADMTGLGWDGDLVAMREGREIGQDR
jgi:Arc/MetJ family transcription regulator